MPDKLMWTDTEDLAILLFEKFPDTDPLTVRFTDLKNRVCDLDEFGDDPATCNEKKLEALQMAWCEECQDA